MDNFKYKNLNLLIGILIFLSIGCYFILKPSEIQEEQKGIKRKFIFESLNYGVEIYLKEDFSFMNFSFIEGCTGGYRVKEVHGKYELLGNKIKFFPQKLIWKEDRKEHYYNTTKKFDTVGFYISDSTKIQNNYWYLKSNTIEFLVSEAVYGEFDEFFIRSSNFIALANLYNANADEKLNSLIFCNSDTIVNIRTVISKSIIPKKYQKTFFNKPKKFKIQNIKVNKELFPVYEILIGENEDVFCGMKLYSEKFPESPITVIEIKENLMIGLGENLFYENTKLDIGTILCTEKMKIKD